MKVCVYLFPCLFEDNIDTENETFSFPSLVNFVIIKDRNFRPTDSTYQSMGRLLKCLFILAQYRDDSLKYTIYFYSSITFLVSMNLSTVQELVHCDTINLIFLNTSSLCKNLNVLISQHGSKANFKR